jgi:hypothetical protein
VKSTKKSIYSRIAIGLGDAELPIIRKALHGTLGMKEWFQSPDEHEIEGTAGHLDFWQLPIQHTTLCNVIGGIFQKQYIILFVDFVFARFF